MLSACVGRLEVGHETISWVTDPVLEAWLR
jgi:hypothetical protein